MTIVFAKRWFFFSFSAISSTFVRKSCAFLGLYLLILDQCKRTGLFIGFNGYSMGYKPLLLGLLFLRFCCLELSLLPLLLRMCNFLLYSVESDTCFQSSFLVLFFPPSLLFTYSSLFWVPFHHSWFYLCISEYTKHGHDSNTKNYISKNTASPRSSNTFPSPFCAPVTSPPVETCLILSWLILPILLWA